MARTIIVSNRLPVRVEKNKGELRYVPSEGGLATGLGSVYKGGGNMWIGWPGINFKKKSDEKEAIEKLSKESMRPVFLTDKEILNFYEGFCNSTLWPNFHYFVQYAIYRKSLWDYYVQVNRKFMNAILEVANPDDTIWVHDYQLLLLPGMLREKLPNISIGFFLHIPFPSHEVFRLIPWRKELLKGILGSDLIGFHTYDDMRHFLSAVNRLVFLGNNHGKINFNDRSVEVDSFPMGIDYDKYAGQAASPETIKQEVNYRTSLGDQKLILSIDRLDYSKGIPARLVIFDLFLKKYPEYREKVSLILLVVPSRDKVDQYKELKEEVDLLVGRINGKYGFMNWTPIHYFYRSLPFPKLSALYRMADVAMVTPMRDGMNLVCKEFVASKLDKKGVLILSEMAGASKELNDALLINPNDKHFVADAIKEALEMPDEEQMEHMENMQKTIKRYNVHHWVDLFLTSLDKVKESQREMATRKVDKAMGEQLSKEFKKKGKKLLFLDYDGTLVNFTDQPADASPDKDLFSILKKLSKIKDCRVVIISGRDKDFLEDHLGKLDVDIISEHGVWLRRNSEEWEMIEELDVGWKKEILPILETYVAKTPGSFIEEKNYSIAWHYRKVETGLGELRTREMISHLRFISDSMSLQVLDGNKVVEVKDIGVNKGVAANKWVKEFKPDIILAMGDDWTDEDMFRMLPEKAITIKVGTNVTEADYNVDSTEKVREFLKMLV